ncbi:protein of unknown function [Aminobacter niigataensis]|nr:protein of unknown function [Aminobacter niigataensis]
MPVRGSRFRSAARQFESHQAPPLLAYEAVALKIRKLVAMKNPKGSSVERRIDFTLSIFLQRKDNSF